MNLLNLIILIQLENLGNDKTDYCTILPDFKHTKDDPTDTMQLLNMMAVQTLVSVVSNYQRLRGCESTYPSTQPKKSMPAPPYEQKTVFMLHI